MTLKPVMLILLLFVIANPSASFADDEMAVGITPTVSYVDVQHDGKDRSHSTQSGYKQYRQSRLRSDIKKLPALLYSPN